MSHRTNNTPGLGRLLVCIAINTLVLTEVRAAWIRDATSWQSAEVAFSPLVLETIGEKGKELIGTGTYYADRLGDATVQIDGALSNDDRFWPKVEMQVAKALNGPWRPVNGPLRVGNAAILTVRYGSRDRTLHFDLRSFRPFVGSLTFGKISLPNGVGAVFRLVDLQPKSSGKENDKTERSNPSSTQSAIYDGIEEREKEPPFVLLQVQSTNRNSIGILGYGSMGGQSVVLKGSRASDGEFWLEARCEVSNDVDGVWRVIGKSEMRGAPDEVTVEANGIISNLHANLDCFRAMIGRIRYGRLTLRNGVSATFDLNRLLPKSGDVLRQ